jgi:uncharacterized protein (TIGR03083 family)
VTQPSISGTRLTSPAYAEHLDTDVRALLDAAGDLGLDVPGCPGWTVSDLVRHVLGVFRSKIAALEGGVEPTKPDAGWGDLPAEADPRVALLEAYTVLRDLLRADASTAAWTWWPAEQTVGFWQRRMALEVAVHRWDAESAVHGVDDAAPVPDDLALDGIDEVTGWLRWPWDDDVQPEASGQRVLISAGDCSWVVTLHPTRVEVTAGSPDSDADALVAGEPSGLLLHLWGRPGEHGIAALGDATALRLLNERLKAV